MGALTMGVNPLSKFYGPKAATPYENCLAIGDEDGDLYHAHWNKEKHEWEWFSRTKDIWRYLKNLEASGIFEASAAFVNNRKILRFYYDPDNGVVRLNPDLRFDATYRYYAIRNISRQADGSYSYVTGENQDDGNIVAVLVNMDLVESETADGMLQSKPATGKIFGEIFDGNAYIVEFYDSNRNLIALDSYQAVKVRTADTDLCPDTAICDMYVSANQQTEDGGIYLRQGQNVDELEIQTRLDYGDNLIKDVSNEEVNGGRLAIQGLDEIDTTTLTGTTGKKQHITVSYQMIRSNQNFKSASSYKTVSGATISPSSRTIYVEIPVTILPSVDTDLVSVIPAGYVYVDTSAMGGFRMKLRFFGHYSDGTVYDVTNVVRYKNGYGFDDTGFGQQQIVSIQVPYGSDGAQFLSRDFVITCPSVTGSSPNYRLTFSNFPKRQITFDETQTGGDTYSGAFTGFAVDNGGVYETINGSSLLSIGDVKFNNLVPNYIRIRDVKDPTYMYTDIIQPTNKIYYKTNSSHRIENDTPLLIEFFRITVDSSSNKVITAFVTGALVHYATRANSN